MLCITIAHEGRHINVVNGKAIGASKHIDYALFHHKASDVKLLKQPFTKFIFINAEGKVSEVILAAQLKERGVNYKTAKREPVELTEVEQEEVATAVELAAEFLRAAAAPKPALAVADATPAAVIAKIFLTPAAVEVGLKEAQQESEKTADAPAEAPAEAPSAVTHAPADAQQADPADQPDEATKIQKKKGRR
jgi:hypothetical protein